MSDKQSMWPRPRKPVSPDKERERYRAVLFWAFISTFVGTVAVTIFAIYHQVNFPSENIPYLGMLITAVLVETAAALFAYWKTLTSSPANPPEQELVTDTINAAIVERLILRYISREIEQGKVVQAIEVFEDIRRAKLEFGTERMLISEMGLRRLVGHGHTVRSRLSELTTPQYRLRFSYEMALLSYANKEQRLTPPSDLQEMDSVSRSLWLSLLAVDCVAANERRKARQLYSMIDHRWDQCKESISTEADVYVAYCSVSNAISAAYLEESDDLEGYLDVARLMKSNVERLFSFESIDYDWGTYPHVAVLSELYFSFVMILLGHRERDGTDDRYIRSIPGPAKVLARHCRVLSSSDSCLSSIELLTSSYRKPVLRPDLIRRLKAFEKKLLINSVNVISGMMSDTEAA